MIRGTCALARQTWWPVDVLAFLKVFGTHWLSTDTLNEFPIATDSRWVSHQDCRFLKHLLRVTGRVCRTGSHRLICDNDLGVQISPCKYLNVSLEEFFGFVRISTSCAHCSGAHVDDEAIAGSERKEFRSTLPEVRNGCIDMTRRFDSGGERLRPATRKIDVRACWISLATPELLRLVFNHGRETTPTSHGV
jgi:hypothetical protein